VTAVPPGTQDGRVLLKHHRDGVARGALFGRGVGALGPGGGGVRHLRVDALEQGGLVSVRQAPLTRPPGVAALCYRKALKIALRWIKNYTELDFRSLGSYTRADLDKIAAASDAL
jgi:hypothetical protein